MLRIDFGGDGWAFDDLAIGGDHVHMIRLERMDRDTFWGNIHLKDGRNLRLSIHSCKGPLEVNGEWE